MMPAAKPAGFRLLRAMLFVAAGSCTGDEGPGPPTNLALIAGSAVTTIRSGVPLEADIAVQLRDARGKNVTRTGIVVTVHVDSATVTGGAIATDGTGQARFTNLRVNGRTGSRTLSFTASDATLLVPPALHVMLAAGLPTQLAVIRGMPGHVQSVTPVTPAPSAQLRDADGNDVPQAGIAVTAVVAGASVAGGTVATDAQGGATFSTMSISGEQGSHTLALSAAGVAPPPGIDFVLYNKPASLALDVALPSTVASGFIVTPPPVVSLRDSTGAVVALAGVAISASTTAPGVVLQGTSVTTDPAGLATFTQLGVTGVAGPLPLSFQASGLAGLTAPPSALVPPDASIAPASLEFGTGAAKILVADPAQSISLPLVTVWNAAGGTVSGAIVNYSARSAAVARIGDDGRVTGAESGQTAIVASAAATPSVTDSVALTVTRSAAGPLLLTDLSTFTLASGSTVDVRVLFDSRLTGPLSAVTVDVAYPRSAPSLLALLSVTPAANASAVASPTAGLVRVVYVNSTGQGGVVEIARLHFQVGSGTPPFSQLVLNPLQVISAALLDVTAITSAINPFFAVR